MFPPTAALLISYSFDHDDILGDNEDGDEKLAGYITNIARIANAVQCRSDLSGSKDCHGQIQVLNFQNCNQRLKCQVSRTVFPNVKNCLNVIKNYHQKIFIKKLSSSAQSASSASSAQSAQSASSASSASSAQSAQCAQCAQCAQSAQSPQSAQSAESAQSAQKAQKAQSAHKAQKPQKAQKAQSAQSAESAQSSQKAQSAQKA